MRRSRFPVLVALLFVTGIISPAYAQDAESRLEAPPQYSLGDQTFCINAGLFLPMFFMSWEPSAAPSNLSPGAMGSILWQAYLAPQIRIGGEIGLLFAFSPNMNFLFMGDLTAKISYIFTVYPFEIPIFLGVGASLVRYQDSQTIDPLLKPGASFFWIFNSSWSFGLNLVYWWDMQFSADPDQSRVGNFLEITLSALYHF